MTGLFPDRQSAEAAYGSVTQRGYESKDVNLVMSDDTRRHHFSGTTDGKETELGNKAAEGAGIGGAIGGTVGAIAAAVAAIGTTLVLPGLGLVIASGGLIGALVGWGMPEERVKDDEEGVTNGRILMGLRARNLED